MNRTTDFSPIAATYCLNSPSATAMATTIASTTLSDVTRDTTNDVLTIKGLPTMKASEVIKATVKSTVSSLAATIVAQTTNKSPGADITVGEQVQILILNLSTTVTTNTKYQFSYGNPSFKDQEWDGIFKPVGYTTPAALSGTASLDEHNVYVALCQRMNTDKRGLCKGYPILSMVVATTTTALTPGSVITGSTSGATGIVLTSTATVLKVALTSLFPYIIFTASEAFTNSIGTNNAALVGTATTVTSFTSGGDGMCIIDQGNYYNSIENRGGSTRVVLNRGFATTDLATPVATDTGSTAWSVTAGNLPTYSLGIGKRMINFAPRMERTTGSLAGGNWEYPTNEAFVDGNTYTRFQLTLSAAANSDALANRLNSKLRTVTIWVKEGGSGVINSTWNTTWTALAT